VYSLPNAETLVEKRDWEGVGAGVGVNPAGVGFLDGALDG
jgi:ElaB/YqjD/DUF883 family membrane-anchored ribosome-binding protein